ncbi:acid phosphatase 1-like [Salvia hispanica]|uniref:acid phosphatase 1-like n=1 Tax=Salvia hispanica TaxID=49212 RepID=UPI00200979A3|nr:acid phosphatase 1-like [Salvia hispanica]
MRLSLLFFFATLLSTSHASFNSDNPIRQLRRPSSGLTELGYDYKINCQSFRVGVEANNVRDWSTVPSYCKNYIKTYLTSKQWGLDVEAVANEAYEYAATFQKDAFLKDIWVFDVEETLVSNLNYLASSTVQYGTQPLGLNYYEWLRANSTVVPAMKELYDALLEMGFPIFLLSAAPSSERETLVIALEDAGYSGWKKLILRDEADNGKSTVQFKSEKRQELKHFHYRVAANVGDQWSDLTGEEAGIRTFKVPNPVYYVL